jgi:hypothetical protein
MNKSYQNEVDIIKCKLCPNACHRQQKLHLHVSHVKAQFQCKFGNTKILTGVNYNPKQYSNMAKVVAQRLDTH